MLRKFIALFAVFLFSSPAFAQISHGYGWAKSSGGSGGGSSTFSGLSGNPSIAQLAPALPNRTNDFRLTLTSGSPVTTGDVTAAATVYESPYSGNSIALYSGTGSIWNTRQSAEMSIAVPASLHRLYDVFCFDSSGTPTLELNAWDSAGQTTGAITAATAAGPCVITATNTLSNGDLVFIDGIVGTLGTNSAAGLNGKCVKVTSSSGTGFTCEGMDTTGLTYTSGGTFYKIPATRTTGLSYQNGILCKTGALTRRYLGSFLTVASAQTEDSKNRRLLFNYVNKKDRSFYCQDSTASWTMNAAGYRAANSTTSAGVGRCEILTGVIEDSIAIKFLCSGANSTSSFLDAGIGINSNVTNSALGAAHYWSQQNGLVVEEYTGALPLGYSFVQRQDGGNVSFTCTFVGVENNGGATIANLLSGVVRQ